MRKTRTDFPAAEQAPQAQPHEVLHFGVYRLDPQNEQLWRNQHVVRLTGKAFSILRHLAHRPSQLVSKHELLRAVWLDTIVSHSTLTSCIKELRKALEDDAKSPQYIETVHRRGYRFIGKVVSSQHSVVSSGEQSGVRSPASAVRRPHSLAPSPSHPAQGLVGRDSELAQLHQWFARACSGERQIVFVTGEAGIGKTALIEAFLRNLESRVQSLESEDQKPLLWQARTLDPRRQALDASLWLGRGQCVEQYGAGEPYMPVLQAFGRLCRSSEKEKMLALLHRHAPTWLVHMPALLSDAERETLQRQVGGATRDRMLREMAEAFEALTVGRPFILCLEDLHWSDYSTLELLAVVAARPEPARLLVLGTSRPFETLGGDHPLKKLHVRIQRAGGYHELTPSFLSTEAVELYLTRRFVDRTLPADAGQLIHQHAEGNPLFMVNVTDYLERQGVLDSANGERRRRMTDGATIGVPESLRQLIEHHLEQLSAEEQDVLTAASVTGMEFSAATVAAGLGQDDEAVEMLCANLVRRRQFLQAVGTAEWSDGAFVARYRFIHALYQNVLYERVSPGRRVGVHLRIGERLEQAYQGRLDEVAVELGAHFEQGRDFRRAVQYFGQAAQNAMWTYAYQEAIDHLNKGIALLSYFPESPERTQQELALQVGLSLSLMHTRGFAAPEVESAYKRIRDLSRIVGDSPQRFAALWGLRNFHLLRGELQAGRAAAQEFLEFVKRTGMSTLAAEAHLGLGAPLFHLGEFDAARPHLEKSFALYNPQLPQPKVLLTGQDPRASSLAHLAVLLWIVGYPDQARERSRQALELAHETMFSYGRALALNLAATLHVCCRDFQAVESHAEAARTFAQECGFVHLLTMGMVLQGWAVAMQGKGDGGITLIQSGLQRQQVAGIGIGAVAYRLLLADAYRKTEQIESALHVLTDAVTAVEQTGERTFEAELYRLKGTLTLEARGWRLETSFTSPQAPSLKPLVSEEVLQETEGYFLKAIEIAQQQHAKSLELRAVTSLVRLRQQQGPQYVTRNTQHKAHSMLSEIYNWFSEGFDTPDLCEAKTLLEELRSGS